MKTKQSPIVTVTKAEARRMSKESDALHHVSHHFQRTFMTDNREWKCIGFELMEKVDKWAKKFPTEVHLSHIDDDFHANSLAVFISHRTPKRYMGVSVVIIPQCTGEKPMTFFLYPSDLKSFRDITAKLYKQVRPRGH